MIITRLHVVRELLLVLVVLRILLLLQESLLVLNIKHIVVTNNIRTLNLFKTAIVTIKKLLTTIE